MKQSIKLTESDIKRIVRESVNRILREEWESPLEKAKKKRNDFDNVKKIDVSKFEKKSKKPKAGTFGDLPSFAKLKNRKDESRLHRIVNESVNRILSEEVDTGQVMPAYERNMAHHISSREEEIRKKIRNLRKMIGDYEDENKDTSELVKQLQRLKKEAGYC